MEIRVQVRLLPAVVLALVMSWSAFGQTHTIYTGVGSGAPGVGGDSGPATSAQLAPPVGVAADAADGLHIADTYNDRIRLLAQAAASCAYSVSPTTLQAPAAGGNLTVSIQTTASCSWTISGLPSWIAVLGAVSGGSGSFTLIGSATVTLVLSPNAAAARSVTISVAGVSVTVTQTAAAAPAPCAYSVSPTTLQASAAGDDLIVSVQTTASCYWTISGLAGWITASGFPLGGPSSFILVVAPNFGASRSATISIAGVSVTVTQPAAAITSPGQTFTTLVSFDGTDGALPYGSLVQGTDGNFYGTTSQGGLGSCSSPPAGCGTVFKITPARTLSALHSFNNSDGANPLAGLTQGTDGNFYGTTTAGGTAGSGTIFKITAAGTLTTLYSFNSQTDGGTPSGLIQAGDGNFYGTTSGTAHVYGTVFKITPGGAFSILHSFKNSDGVNPMAGVIQGTDGNLYGTTLQSYMSTNDEFGGYGTIFKITLGGSLTTMHSFAGGADGASPFTRLTQAGDGNFYGIAFGGGGWGTIFKITPGGSFGVLHSFNYTDGDYAIIGGVYPHGGLIQGADGNLYATTTLGGTGLVYGVAAGGTIFQITLAGTLTTVYNIRGIDGNTFHGDLIQGADGNFYGTTSVGGASNDGTVFSFAPPATPTVIASPTSVSFAYQAGGDTPLPASISVTGSASGLRFSATGSALSGGNWLSVSPSSGATPGSVTVSVNPFGLTANTYSGTVLVSGAGGASGSTIINVTLTVTAPLPSIKGVTNAASYATGAVSPGELVTVFGTAIGPATAAGATTDTSTGKLATTIGGVQVLFNGTAAPMIYAGSTQVSAVVPYEMALVPNPSVSIKYAGQTSNAFQLITAATAPGLFTQNASGSGPGAILNQDNSVNGPGNAAAKGSIVQVYLTGEGQTSPQSVTGAITTATLPPPQVTPAPLLAVGVLINGQPASYVYAGEAPGLVAGMMQLNVQIPANALSGDLPILVSVGGNISQSGVTVSVR